MTDKKLNQLPVPSAAIADPNSFEIARIWHVHDVEQVSFNAGQWEDPAAWGVMLADFALQIAKAYQGQRGIPAAKVLARIKQGFDAEWDHPTTDVDVKSLGRDSGE